MPIPKLNLACLGVRTKLLLLQVQQNHPVCVSHVHILSHGAPCLTWLYEHVMLHIQHRVRIGLFPVPLCAVNFISLTRPSHLGKNNNNNNRLDSFPSSLPCSCNRRKKEWICSIKLMQVLWTVLWYYAKENCPN